MNVNFSTTRTSERFKLWLYAITYTGRRKLVEKLKFVVVSHSRSLLMLHRRQCSHSNYATVNRVMVAMRKKKRWRYFRDKSHFFLFLLLYLMLIWMFPRHILQKIGYDDDVVVGLGFCCSADDEDDVVDDDDELSSVCFQLNNVFGVLQTTLAAL